MRGVKKSSVTLQMIDLLTGVFTVRSHAMLCMNKLTCKNTIIESTLDMRAQSN